MGCFVGVGSSSVTCLYHLKKHVTMEGPCGLHVIPSCSSACDGAVISMN